MRGSPISYFDWSGGVNLEAAPYLIKENQARDALNVHTNPEGQLRKRNGFPTHASLSASPASFTGAAHSLFAANLSTKYLLAVGPISGPNDRVVSITVGGTVTSRTALSYTANQPWYIAQGEVTSDTKGPIFAMNGVDTPQYWTGTGNFANWTAASGTLPTTGKFLVYHGSRLWCRDNSSNPSRLRYSGITGTSPDTGNWDTSNYVDFDPNDGQEITAIAPFGPYLMVFKPRKIFVVYDLITGANRCISENVGCVAHRSCVSTPRGLFFLDEDQGIMVTDGDKIEQVSNAIGPLMRTVATHAARIEYAAGTYHDNRYFLSVSQNGSVNDTTIEYDLDTQSWWLHDCASNQFALVDPVGTPALYSVHPTSVRSQQAFAPGVFQDSGANYAGGSFWEGPHWIWKQPHVSKRVREVRVDGTGIWTLGYAADYATNFSYESGEIWSTPGDDNAGTFAPPAPDGELFAPTVSTSDLFAPTTTVLTDRRYYTLGLGRAWSFRFQNDDSADFQIYSLTVALTGRVD